MKMDIFDQLSEVIAASSTKLGLVALMVILTGFLAYKFFEKREATTQLKVFSLFGSVLAVLALVVLLLPEGNGQNPSPPASAQTPESEPETKTETETETEPEPEPPPPIQAWSTGADFRRALERVGGVYRVLEEEKACTIENRGEWVRARVKAGLVGNKCEFEFQGGVVLDTRCRILEWDFDQPNQTKFTWITQPQSGHKPLVLFRMWADIPGRETHLSLRRVLLAVPGTSVVNHGEIGPNAFYQACLAPTSA